MTLNELLAQAYRAEVMGNGSRGDALALFAIWAAEDPARIDQARAELARCRRAGQQCFVSKQSANFLRSALADIVNQEPSDASD